MPNNKLKNVSVLQKIGDFYFEQGFRGKTLTAKLQKDKEYQKLLQEKKKKITEEFKISPLDKKKYSLATSVDFEILSKCKQLEKMSLCKNDKNTVALIKSQLLDDWRTPLLKKLSKLLRQYKIK